ncbi:hypothetical protein [Anaerotignum sp.]|uniref:hypothetical protein n=1 Tax=Anaerotignum sp. TaxID=2039241 RepID=UPI0037354445
MRYRKIFLVAGMMVFMSGCGDGDRENAEGQIRREVMENAQQYQQEKIYIKGPEGTPFAFLVEENSAKGEVVRKGIGGCGESWTKQEIDEKMLEAVLGKNGEEKEKSQKNEKNEKK